MHWLTASGSSFWSLISRRYSSAFWLSFCRGAQPVGESGGVLTGQGEPWEPQHPWDRGAKGALAPGRDLRDLPLPITAGSGLHQRHPSLLRGRQDPGWGSGPYLVLLLCLQQERPWGHGGDLEDLLAGLCRDGGKKKKKKYV